MEAKIDIANTVFIVSSKSGGTTEPNAMKDYFHARVAKAVGPKVKTGHRFIAVTDPGSSLEKAAKKLNYARIFHGEPSIGGRYSVLSPFGLVPAATAGIDVKTFVRHVAPFVPRVSLTLPVLASCREMLFEIAGHDKQPILTRLLNGETLPALRARSNGETVWLVDQAALPEGIRGGR